MSGPLKPDTLFFEIIAVAYQRYGPLKVFVQSWLNQTAGNWRLRVVHDGPDGRFDEIMAAFAEEAAGRIAFSHTPDRHNDYGHTLRHLALQHASGDYVVLTNADNYYIPKAIEFLSQAAEQTSADVLLFDMIHSHDRPGGRPLPAYSFFQTQYSRLNIDIGAAAVRGSLARASGFPDRSHDGDATYFENVARVKEGPVTVCKVPRVLLVHN